MDCPPLICNVRTPRIYWYQNELEVVLRIMLHDLHDYYIRVNIDEFEFSTSSEDANYHVYLHLFGAVLAEQTIQKNTGREIKVHLPKARKWLSWPRLLYMTAKCPQIFLDVEHLESSKLRRPNSNNEEREDFAAYKRRHQIENIMPDVPSSSEAESDDEIYDDMFD